jgi:hypothetical protein
MVADEAVDRDPDEGQERDQADELQHRGVTTGGG